MDYPVAANKGGIAADSSANIGAAAIAGRLAVAAGTTVPGVVGGSGVSIPAIGAELTAATSAGLLIGTLSISGSEPNKTIYVTYTRVNPITGEVYSGRTHGEGDPQSIVTQRGMQQSHLNKEGFAPPVVDRWSSDGGAIRGREQQLIDFFGGARSVGGTSRNMINGVSDFNPNRIYYIPASIATFGPLPDNSPPRFRLGFP
ncbi:MAG: hypothetical protein K2P84_12070 [Undibacterium sp.]|nr:hypothetical protein [Undibacterium sp.]